MIIRQRSTVPIVFEYEALYDFFKTLLTVYEADKRLDFLSEFEHHEILRFLDNVAPICGYIGIDEEDSERNEQHVYKRREK